MASLRRGPHLRVAAPSWRAPARLARRGGGLAVALLSALVAALVACAPRVAAAPTPFDPAAWTDADIGGPSMPGGLEVLGSSTIRVFGSGSDIWGSADSFHFLYRSFSGDVDVRARIDALERTDAWAKAGVMVRAGPEAGAIHAMLSVTPAGFAEFINRSATDQASTSTVRGDVSLPVWVRLLRKGASLTGYLSADGRSWTEVGTVDLAMPTEVLVGLSLASRNPARLAQTEVSGLSAAEPSAASAPGGSIPAGQWPWVCPAEPLSPVFEPTLFVATTGSNANDGRSPDRPLRTLRQAAALVRPGDVVWIRGGVYSSDVQLTRSGTAEAPIVFESYPGECAVLDGAGLTGRQRLTLAEVRYNVLRNLVVRNSPDNGVLVLGSDHNVVTNLNVYNSLYSGVANVDSSHNDYRFIVSHDNFNPPDGGDADGISLSSGDANHVSHCIVYGNSDDGVDTWRSTNSVVERCISVHNGFQGGDGKGFKAGGAGALVRTVVRESLAYDNKSDGFDHNTGVGVRFDNDTAYANGGYGFVAASSTLRNNLAVDNRAGAWAGEGYDNERLTNSWDLGIRGSQFLSIDPASADFLALAPDSRAVGVGSDIGLPFEGRAPDLGALPLGQRLVDLIGAGAAEAVRR